MGILKAFAGAVGGTLADQWKDLITADDFGEHTAVAPGRLKATNRDRGSNIKSSENVISNGSKIFVPENTAAFIFSDAGIENVVTAPGGYEYQDGEASIFNHDGFAKSIVGQAASRFGFGGVPQTRKEVAFVNLREIRGIRFGTNGPQIYNDIFYGCDLDIIAHGAFSLKIIDAEKFIRGFVPPNTRFYSFDNEKARMQVCSDFLQLFIASLNTLSKSYRVSELPAHANEISQAIKKDENNAGSWRNRFGFELTQVSIEHIELTPASRELIQKYNANKLDVQAYEEISQKASNIAAQQKIASGVQEQGLGDGGGMLLGMNIAQGVSSTESVKTDQPALSLNEQIETLQKLKELLDNGVLSNDEFDTKKKEVLNMR